MSLRGRRGALTAARIRDLTSDSFDETLREARLLFVDFWAAWCRPCRAMAPVIRSLARTFPDRVVFARVDTESEGELSRRFRVRSIPTYILFKNARVVERFSGVASRDRLARKIEKWM